ncbi:MAG: F0F1 ATP synthase subunit A [Nannocystaceae bacterium]
MSPIFTVHLFGLAFADTIFVSLALTGILVGLSVAASRGLRTRGLGLWQAALEGFTGWIDDTIREMVEEDPAPYVPLIGTLMVFVGVSNLLSLVPIVRPPTADLATALALALVVFAAVPAFGIRRHGLLGYLRSYVQPHPLLLPFNLIGELTRTISLAIRLFGNIMSGQLIGAIILVIAGALVPVPLMILGALTGLVQAYIFGVLAAVYIAAAIQVDTRNRPPVDPPTPPQGAPA